MSIKTKIPIMIAIMFLINSVLLYLYFHFFFYSKLSDKIRRISGITISKNVIRQNKIIHELLYFELYTIAILIILFGIIIYIIYAKPLDKLNLKVRNYKNSPVLVTDRKDEIGQLQNTFAKLSGELEEEKQIQNRIIASISHDIKTPLTSVLGYSESLMKKDLPRERVQQYLQVIYSKAKDIEEIVRDFDTYIEGKLTTGLNRQNCNISFLEDMLQLEYQKDLQGKGVAFEVINHTEPAGVISIDLPKIRRVFANLIGNSIKHNRNKIDLSILVFIDQKDDIILFKVADNGCGILQKDFTHVFEPFYTSDDSRAVSGMGLSICKNIIEAHSGEIWAENEEEKGTVICFTIGRISL